MLLDFISAERLTTFLTRSELPHALSLRAGKGAPTLIVRPARGNHPAQLEVSVPRGTNVDILDGLRKTMNDLFGLPATLRTARKSRVLSVMINGNMTTTAYVAHSLANLALTAAPTREQPVPLALPNIRVTFSDPSDKGTTAKPPACG